MLWDALYTTNIYISWDAAPGATPYASTPPRQTAPVQGPHPDTRYPKICSARCDETRIPEPVSRDPKPETAHFSNNGTGFKSVIRSNVYYKYILQLKYYAGCSAGCDALRVDAHPLGRLHHYMGTSLIRNSAPPRTLQLDSAQGPMVALGEEAVSCQRGILVYVQLKCYAGCSAGCDALRADGPLHRAL